MTSPVRIPAAQYVRMSTEHQQYSLDNQMAAIQQYADAGGFAVLQTYTDAGKSGLVLRHRSGLRSLLHDVVSGTAGFKAILVYNVSHCPTVREPFRTQHSEQIRQFPLCRITIQ